MKKTQVNQSAVAPAAVDPNDIAVAAYYAWENAGRPEGRDEEYWRQAEEQFRANNGAASATSKARAPRKSGVARAV